MAPYEVYYKKGGPFTVVESLEEADKLMKMGNARTIELPVTGRTSLSETESMHEFILAINSNARNFLVNLANHPEGTTGEKFALEIGLSTDKFGGVLGGASKIALRLGLNFSQMVRSELRTEGTTRYRWLAPGPLLMRFRGDFKPVGVRIVENRA